MVGDRFVHVEAGRPAKRAGKGDSLVFKVHIGPAEHGLLSTSHDFPLFRCEYRYSSRGKTCLSIMAPVSVPCRARCPTYFGQGEALG